MQKLNLNFKFDNEEEIVAKMKKLYENCPTAVKYIVSLGIPEEKINNNIGKIYDFVCDINYCKNCPGFANCAKNNKHMITKITYENNIVDTQITPCKMLTKQILLEKQFVCRDFDDKLLTLSLSDIDGKNNEERKALLNSYKSLCKENDTTWMYITGAEGTGRSYLATVLAVDLAKKDRGPIAFINASKRFKELATLSIKDEENFQKRMNILLTVPVLVIDDFGNEFKTDFVRDAILLPILSKRSARKLFTIFTSDFTIEDIETMYDTSKSAGIRAKQISRILNSSSEEFNLGEVSPYL